MDDMLPNDGSFFHITEPEDQAKERRKEEGKAKASMPLLQDIIADFDKDLEQLGRIDSIDIDPDINLAEFKEMWTIHQELKKYIETKQAYWRSLYDSYK